MAFDYDNYFIIYHAQLILWQSLTHTNSLPNLYDMVLLLCCNFDSEKILIKIFSQLKRLGRLFPLGNIRLCLARHFII